MLVLAIKRAHPEYKHVDGCHNLPLFVQDFAFWDLLSEEVRVKVGLDNIELLSKKYSSSGNTLGRVSVKEEGEGLTGMEDDDDEAKTKTKEEFLADGSWKRATEEQRGEFPDDWAVLRHPTGPYKIWAPDGTFFSSQRDAKKYLEQLGSHIPPPTSTSTVISKEGGVNEDKGKDDEGGEEVNGGREDINDGNMKCN